MKSIIYVQHCLIPPVTLQTSPRGILEPWTYSRYCPSPRGEIFKIADRYLTFHGPSFEELEQKSGV